MYGAYHVPIPSAAQYARVSASAAAALVEDDEKTRQVCYIFSMCARVREGHSLTDAGVLLPLYSTEQRIW